MVSFQGSLERKKGQTLTMKICSCTSALTGVHPSRIAEKNLHSCGICRELMSCWIGLGLLCHSWQKSSATILWYYMAGLKYRLFLEVMLTADSQVTEMKMFLP